VRKADIHNRYGLICVSMEFDTMPYYGAHATDPQIRHEDYLRQVVVPLIEERCPAAAEPGQRLLLGFSKSGWGAVTLLLRNLDFFGAACSWDAPLCFTEKDFGQVGTRPHYGTAEQMAKYLPLVLAEQRAAELGGGRIRLAIFGKDHWGPHSRKYHEHLERLSIPHLYDDSLTVKHTWASGWVPQALDLFLPACLPGAPAQ
jgi:S-formylglutathione hydrolase FrmB